jgi:hypothetical protein
MALDKSAWQICPNTDHALGVAHPCSCVERARGSKTSVARWDLAAHRSGLIRRRLPHPRSGGVRTRSRKGRHASTARPQCSRGPCDRLGSGP